jgi:antitoxin HicB
VSALPDEDGGGFQAAYGPLARSVAGYGTTRQEALGDLEIATGLFLVNTNQSLTAYEPRKEWEEFSGKFNVRVAKALHAQLSELAEEQGVSLNSLVQTILSSGATALADGRMFGAVKQLNGASKSPYAWDPESVPSTNLADSMTFVTKAAHRDEWAVDCEA